MVIAVADETPWADVIQSPRTAAVPLPVLGRCIAGLAEAIQLRLHELDAIDHLRTTVDQLAQALSAIGQSTSENTPDHEGHAAAAVMMPPGLVNRAARYLQAAAILAHQGVLPQHFRTAHAGPARKHLPARRREPALLRRRAWAIDNELSVVTVAA